MMKVLLDTDIGYNTDADDALALAYLLCHPECELLGVTTVGLHAEWRAELAALICRQAGVPDLPVLAGADRPLFDTTYWPENPVRRWPGEDAATSAADTWRPGAAVPWLRETIRRHPGEITLVTIGQFTNLALLLLTDPEAVGLLKGIVSMGGVMGHSDDGWRAECNVMLDPVATGIVLQRLGPELTLLPLDSVDPVIGVRVSLDEVGTLLPGPRWAAVRDCCRCWMEYRGMKGVGLPDPAACALAFEPDLAVCEQARVAVHLHDYDVERGTFFPAGEATGVTRLVPNGTGGCRLVKTVDVPRLRAHLAAAFASA